MMCVSHPVRLFVCNTFHFVLVVFGTCLCAMMRACVCVCACVCVRVCVHVRACVL